MLILKIDKEELEFKVTFSKANRLAKEVCKEDENLLTVVPSKMMSADGGEFLVHMLCVFQVADKKLSEEEIEGLLDKYFEEEGNDFYQLYGEILKEFDVGGVFKNGMGFSMAKKISKTLEDMETKLAEVDNEVEITEN